MLHAWERREKRTRFWWESPKEGDHLEDRGVDGKMGSEWILVTGAREGYYRSQHFGHVTVRKCKTVPLHTMEVKGGGQGVAPTHS
jgi:hypothetical protein